MSILSTIFAKPKHDDHPPHRLPSSWQQPVSGSIIPLSELPDHVFSEGIMGAGFAIQAENSTITSPLNGTIVSIFPGGHAIALKDNNGCEVLLHIGIDTVSLKGEGFTPYVESNTEVKQGEELVHVDFDTIAQKVPDTSVIVVFPNIESGTITADDNLLTWHE